MSKTSRVAAGVIAGLAAALVGLSIASATADSTSNPTDTPSVDAKSTAIAAPQDTTIPTDVPSYTYSSPTAPAKTYVTPVAPTTGQNSVGPGPGMVRANATAPDNTTQAINLLSQYYSLMSMPDAVSSRPAYISSNASNRQSVINATWDSSVAASQLSQLNSALNAVANDPTYSAFQSATVVITATQSETDNADGSVNLVLIGHVSYLNWDGTTANDPDSQWQVNLTPSSSGGLVLHDYGQVDLQ